jgi:hypothetical protein
MNMYQIDTQMAEKGGGQTNWILDIMEDGGPNAYQTTSRPNTAQSYRITAKVERKKNSGSNVPPFHHFDLLPHHLVIIARTLKHTQA